MGSCICTYRAHRQVNILAPCLPFISTLIFNNLIADEPAFSSYAAYLLSHESAACIPHTLHSNIIKYCYILERQLEHAIYGLFRSRIVCSLLVLFFHLWPINGLSFSVVLNKTAEVNSTKELITFYTKVLEYTRLDVYFYYWGRKFEVIYLLRFWVPRHSEGYLFSYRYWLSFSGIKGFPNQKNFLGSLIALPMS